MLGNLYANGEGTARDLVRAYMWQDIAATAAPGKTPDEAAKKIMEAANAARDKTSALLQPEEEEVEAQQLASDWWLSRQTKAQATPKKKSRPTKKNP